MPSALLGGLTRSSRISASPRRSQRWVRDMQAQESRLESVTDDQLRGMAESIRQQATDRGPTDGAVMQYSAIVGEAIFRAQGIRLYPVQRQAIKACLGRNIAEMQTGEGKTVVTGAIAAVNTLVYPSVHVATTNTYLAERDLESMATTFDFLGLSHSLLAEDNDVTKSRRAYQCQIVYGPGYQFGFDYLRDQMELRKNRPDALGAATARRIRGKDDTWKRLQDDCHHLALIDEADSVLIDEALTPMIISMPSTRYEDPTPYLIAKKFAANLEKDTDFTVQQPGTRIVVEDATYQRAHDAISDRPLELSRPWRMYITNAIAANEKLIKNIDYVVLDDKVAIVDQFTGRILADRTWQDGLHQAVEAKEGLEIQQGRESTTQITRQRYLQLYQSISGLTGTGMVAQAEFRSVYQCGVIPIPTHKPNQRQILTPRFFVDDEAKHRAIAQETIARHATGQPILVGTQTIQDSLEIEAALIAEGLSPVILNGVQDLEEAEIVSQAGKSGSITIATNMAGRGTDIKIDPRGLEAGGLHVIGASPNASKRVDRQLVGRSARQGQPGSAQFFVAATDSVIAENRPSLQHQIERRARRNGESANFSNQLSKLQDSIEARDYRSRQKMIQRDFWMDTVRESIERE